MFEPRGPADVPDVGAARFDLSPFGGASFDVASAGLGPLANLVLDTDGDGRADTSVADDGIDLMFGVDVDADGIVDEILRIGPDGIVKTEVPDELY